jgi:hypothetical protein
VDTQVLPVLAKEFLRYAERDYRGGSSHLYEALSYFVAGDVELLEIASHGQSAIPNLFFGAVHYLLMRSKKESLAEYYPSLHKPTKTGDDLFPLLRSFCIRHREQLIEIISSKIVQTNEVSRCAYLYPAFAFVSNMVGDAPLAMIDVGASAGLHLLWDLYGYDYGIGIYGRPASSVRIKCELRGNSKPALFESVPRVQSRFGIDLQLISPDKNDDVMWLDALIWPEHESRRELFHKAIDMLKQERTSITFVEGDVADVLPNVLARVPAGEIPCVYQTHIWRQLPEAAKAKLITTLENVGRERKVFFVSALNQLTLQLFAPSGNCSWTLANYEQHGRWVEWLAETEAF